MSLCPLLAACPILCHTQTKCGFKILLCKCRQHKGSSVYLLSVVSAAHPTQRGSHAALCSSDAAKTST